VIFTNNLSPIAVRFHLFGHDFPIRWYGLAYISSFAMAYFAFRWAAKNGKVQGLTLKAVDDLTFGLILGVVAGGRIGFAVQNLSQWAKDPLFVFKIWQGGMAFFGGLAGVCLAIFWICRKYGLRWLPMADIATFPAAMGLFVGRLANFANKELWGRPTRANWGVIYPNIDQQPRHPSELYEATSHLLTFFILLGLAQLPYFRIRRGRLAAMFLFLYGGLRFVTDFWREEPIVGGLNTGQWASLIVALIGILLFVALRKTTPAPNDVPNSNDGARPPA
jgi:phosphatidylglycerol:prolipoprotein diacylglycerol transferase